MIALNTHNKQKQTKLLLNFNIEQSDLNITSAQHRIITIKLLNLFKLSNGMHRIYIVLSVVSLILLNYYLYEDLDKANQWRKDNVSASGVTITAISPTVSTIKNTIIQHSTTNVPVAYGWAAYLCLFKAGKHLYVNDNHIANSHMYVSDFTSVTNTHSFQQCINNEITNAENKIFQTLIKNILLSLLLLLLVFLTLRLATIIVSWIINGFKIDKNIT
ncbi:MAG: hypothetical protein ACRC0M_00020 [Legionella sp.]